MEVNVMLQDVKVVINLCIGLVVMNWEVMLDSCVVVQGNLLVIVNCQFNVNQLNMLFGGGQIVVMLQIQIDLCQSGGLLQSVCFSVNLNSVVCVLNVFGVMLMDLMLILQFMQSVGCLCVKLEII